ARAGRARGRGRGSRARPSLPESCRLDAMFPGDDFFVFAHELTVADDLLAAHVEAVDTVRRGEHEASDRIRRPAELEAVRAPDGEVGALSGRQLAEGVPPQYCRSPARAEPACVARRERLRPP